MANIHFSQRRTRFFRNTSSLGIKTGFHRKSQDLAMGIMGVVEVEAVVVVVVVGEGEGAVGISHYAFNLHIQNKMKESHQQILKHRN